MWQLQRGKCADERGAPPLPGTPAPESSGAWCGDRGSGGGKKAQTLQPQVHLEQEAESLVAVARKVHRPRVVWGLVQSVAAMEGKGHSQERHPAPAWYSSLRIIWSMVRREWHPWGERVQLREAPCPNLVIQPQNHPELGAESVAVVVEKGKVYSSAITQSSLRRDKQGLREALGKESTPPPAQCSRSPTDQSLREKSSPWQELGSPAHAGPRIHSA